MKTSDRQASTDDLASELDRLRQQVAELEAANERQGRRLVELERDRDLSEYLIRSSAVGIFAFDQSFRYTVWDSGMEEISGVGREVCLCRVAFEVFPFLIEHGIDEYMKTALSGRDVVACDLFYSVPEANKEGYFDLHLTPLHGTEGDIVGAIGSATEVTERTMAEEALKQAYVDLEARIEERTSELRQEKELSESLIRNMGNPLFAYDRDLRLTLWNPAMEKLTRVPKEAAIGQGCLELCQVLRQIADDSLLRAPFEGRALWSRDRPYRVPDADELGYCDAYYAPIHSSQDEIIAALGILHDVTERKQLEEERLRASKLESLGVLAGGLAHDFNNILTGILGNNAYAKLLVEQNAKVHKVLERTERACMQAADLTGQLLTFAKGGSPVKKTASLAELIRDSAEFAVHGSNVRCEVHLGPDMSPVEVDTGQIHQVIQNVVINACQAMPEGGLVQIRTRNVAIDGSSQRSIPPGRYVELAIHDEGIGMPEGIIKKIFDPYYTTKQKGSGLGLATAYSIIQNHRGAITVESQVGGGSTFRIYLPVSDRALETATVAQVALITGGGRILVMEDNSMVREAAGRLLEEIGFEVTFAQDGDETLRCYEAALDDGQPFDVVMLDLTVPGGMGGREAMEQLRQLDPRVKAIVASGYSDDPVMADYEAYGFSARMTKPYLPDELARVLQRVLEA